MKAFILKDNSTSAVKAFGSIQSVANFLTSDGKSKCVLSDEHKTVFGMDIEKVYYSGMIIKCEHTVELMGMSETVINEYTLSDCDFIA